MTHYKRSYFLPKGLNQKDRPVKNSLQVKIRSLFPFVISEGQLKMFLLF